MDASPTLKNIERDLDNQQAKETMTQQERSKLVGWSPSLNAMDSTVMPELPSFDLDGGGDLDAGSAAPSQPGAPPAAVVEAMKEKKEKASQGKGPPRDLPKKEKMSKADRRELQEKQRAAKLAKGKGKGGGGVGAPGGKPPSGKPSLGGAGGKGTPRGAGGRGANTGRSAHGDAAPAKKLGMQRPIVQKQVPLFSHLPQYEAEGSLSRNVGFSKNEIHPAILKLGLKYEARLICGANARCVAMLIAFKEVINDYSTPPNKMLSWDLDKRLKPLIQVRPNAPPCSAPLVLLLCAPAVLLLCSSCAPLQCSSCAPLVRPCSAPLVRPCSAPLVRLTLSLLLSS
jgi:translation initiation factor eIF-2B subunit delta